LASNDPTDTGGLFVGRRPGTAPVKYREQPPSDRAARQRADRAFAALLLVIETILCVSLWGPQPVGWLWVGSRVDYWTDSVSLGIVSAFLGMLATLFITLMIAKRVDHAWKLVRRASGIRQEKGALERIFMASLLITAIPFLVWFFFIEGPGPSLAPQE
jgi:hypothetical protein